MLPLEGGGSGACGCESRVCDRFASAVIACHGCWSGVCGTCWWREADDRTAVVMLYLETFGNPEHFTRIARRVSRNKPILAPKGRRSAARVLSEARSHTAAALRSDAAVDALLRQAGVLRFRGGEELFDTADFFERQRLPRGRRIGIVSNSAGVATLAADACATRGLQVSEVSEAQNPMGRTPRMALAAARRAPAPSRPGRAGGAR